MHLRVHVGGAPGGKNSFASGNGAVFRVSFQHLWLIFRERKHIFASWRRLNVGAHENGKTCIRVKQAGQDVSICILRMAMSKSLVIVESPAKAKTIEKYLGSGFEVLASVGHIMDLPKNDIGVELENRTFEPTLIVSPGKEKVVAQLKKAAAKADEIYLAPDPDREGEAIAYHLAIQLGTSAKERKKIRRVTFNEITKKAVQEAFKHARDVDQNLVDAQQTRRVLDRLVGYQISPLLWDKVRRGLSAGRVQTVAVRLIVEREREIGAFKPVEYWTLDAMLHQGGGSTARNRAVQGAFCRD